ncbi:hypothetical protein L917_00837, partial [Phytophthora nicotianae]
NSFRASVFFVCLSYGAQAAPFCCIWRDPQWSSSSRAHGKPELSHKRHTLSPEKAHYDEERMLEWIDEVWKPSVCGPRLLLLDSLKIYKMASVRNAFENECCTAAEFISPGITGLAQPMDVSVMRVFKSLCRNYYVNHHAVNDFAQGAPARRALITEIVINAWKAVRAKVIVRGFIKAGIVPYGPRDAEENFIVDPPEESEENNNNEVE